MRTSVRRAAAGIALLGLAAGTALSGCAPVERETGFGRTTQTGAVGGAVAGGTAAALATANPAWVAASAILGGVAGGTIGEALSDDDVRTAAYSNYSSLESLQVGQTRAWRNPATGTSGSTTVQDSFLMANGTVCTNFVETIRTPEKTVSDNGTVCKAPGKDWQLQP